MKKKLVFGRTGGVATGKTSVSSMFTQLGGYSVSADEIAHIIILKGKPAYKKIIKKFGKEILNNKKEIDRRKLGKLVFNAPLLRKALVKITHPEIIRTMKSEIEKGKKSAKKFIVMEAPLLFEAKLENMADMIVVVASSRKNQLKRQVKKGYSRQEAGKRINSQMNLKKKVDKADYVVSNNETLKNTLKQVKDIIQEAI